MPEDKTLYFGDPRHLSALYAGDERNLAHVEEALGVSLVTRDDWLRIEGESEAAIERAAQVFVCLDKGRRNGLRIALSDLKATLRWVLEDNQEALRALFDEPLVLRLKRRSVVPKTLEQKRYLKSMRSEGVVFGVGPAGTGKTYLAVAAALFALLQDEVERIILTRPAVEAGEALGFLPGDLTEKIEPYLLPLYDAVYDLLGRGEGRKLLGQDRERGDRREERSDKIEIAPLAYMRGRTLSRAFIILDEAQNTTPEQMMMFLTRLGEGSRMAITGDKTQIDLPRHKYSGLKEAEKVLDGVDGVVFHQFSGRDVVRHPLVLNIIEAYAAYEKATGAHSPREVHPDGPGARGSKTP